MNNPPAFPSSGDIYTGMTLRDYLAAKAMQALISLDKYEHKQTASESYKYADAMLVERNE